MRALFIIILSLHALGALAAAASTCNDIFAASTPVTLKQQMVRSLEQKRKQVEVVIDEGLMRIEKSVLTETERKVVNGILADIAKLKASDYTHGHYQLHGSKIDALVGRLRTIRAFASPDENAEGYIAFAVTRQGIDRTVFKDSRHALLYGIARTSDMEKSNWIYHAAESLFWTDNSIREISQLEDFGVESREQLTQKTGEVVMSTLKALQWKPEIYNSLKSARLNVLNRLVRGDRDVTAYFNRVELLISMLPAQFKQDLKRWELEQAIAKNYMSEDYEILHHFATFLGRLDRNHPAIQELEAVLWLNLRYDAINENRSDESLRERLNDLF